MLKLSMASPTPNRKTISVSQPFVAAPPKTGCFGIYHFGRPEARGYPAVARSVRLRPLQHCVTEAVTQHFASDAPRYGVQG